MSNTLSDLQYNPNSSLVKSVEDFYRKPNKTKFEEQIIAKNIDDVGNIDAFFAVIYGDRAMRQADFEKAKSYYTKAQNFTGIRESIMTGTGILRKKRLINTELQNTMVSKYFGSCFRT
jgi:hypothetical protein